ncbi:MAG: hypothetical protein M3126_09535, partial [Candidatus Eremiobacteraeota bacterium]|nr:hypothetical protein [Candidatus Eremiobacteraeota bacterium]
MLNVRTHRLYERWIPASARTRTEGASVVAFKAETVEVFSSRHIFIDALIGADEWLEVLPFLEFVPGPEPFVVCPAIIAHRFPILSAAVSEIAKNWFLGKGQPQDAVMDFFVNDRALSELFTADEPNILPAFPGFAAMSTLIRVATRYARAIPFARQRRCIDLRAAMGFGSFQLGPPQDVECVTGSRLHREVAARMGIDVHETPLHDAYEVALALDVPLEDADEWIERVRALSGRGGYGIVSVRGDVLDCYEDRASHAELIAIPADGLTPASQETFLVFDNRAVVPLVAEPVQAPLSVLPPPLSVRLLPGERADSISEAADQTRSLARTLRARGHRIAIAPENEANDECDII